LPPATAKPRDIGASDDDGDDGDDDYSDVLAALWRLLLGPVAAAAAAAAATAFPSENGNCRAWRRTFQHESSAERERQPGRARAAHWGPYPVTVLPHYPPARCVLGTERVRSLGALRFAGLVSADKRV
jgi:hypothetical protein